MLTNWSVMDHSAIFVYSCRIRHDPGLCERDDSLRNRQTTNTHRLQLGRSGYKLSQLCSAARFHPSTVHYYVKIGLLHKPRKAGLGLYLYDENHLKTLDRIRGLRVNNKLSLSEIKEVLANDPEVTLTKPLASGQGEDALDSGNREQGQVTKQAESTRQKILDTAVRLFSERGYDGTTIADITETLRMSKGSFYFYFRDKRKLFIECMERLTDVIAAEEAWAAMPGERGYMARQAKRVVRFIEAFPSYAGIIPLLKMAANGEDEGLAQKATKAIARIAGSLVRGYRSAIADGVVRDLDEEFLGYALLGIAENVGFKLVTDPRCDRHDWLEKFVDLTAHGVLSRRPWEREKARARGRPVEITDLNGERIQVHEISFGGKPYIAGRLGAGEIRSDMEQTAFIQVRPNGPVCTAEVTLKDGQRTILHQEANLIVSGGTSMGLFTIPLNRVRSISFR